MVASIHCFHPWLWFIEAQCNAMQCSLVSCCSTGGLIHHSVSMFTGPPNWQWDTLSSQWPVFQFLPVRRATSRDRPQKDLAWPKRTLVAVLFNEACELLTGIYHISITAPIIAITPPHRKTASHNCKNVHPRDKLVTLHILIVQCGLFCAASCPV